MTPYIKHQVKSFYTTYLNRSFDQDGFSHFVTSVRDYSSAGSIFRELGDFLAHPNSKDRGLALNSIKSIEKPFDDYIKKSLTKDSQDANVPTFPGIGTKSEIAANFHAILKEAEISSPYISLDHPSFRELIFCIIFLLSGFRIEIKRDFFGRKMPSLLELEVIYSRGLTLQTRMPSSKFHNCYAVLPILTLENVWRNSPSLPTPYPQLKLKEYIARRLDSRHLAAFSYTTDPGASSITKSSTLNPGDAFPLFNPPENGAKKSVIYTQSTTD